MSADRLADLSAAGVSIWLDDLDRGRLESGGLAALVEGSHVVGVTTNPSIFDKAITSGATEYAAQVKDLAVRGVDLGEAIRALTTYDVRWACDVLAPVHARTGEVVLRDRSFARANSLHLGDRTLVLDENGLLALCRFSPDRLDILARYQALENKAWTPPSLVGTTLYLRDRKTIKALSLR